MHELPVISRVVDICLKHAAKNNARKILSIELKVGPLSDLEPEWMQRYFDHVSKDTIAAGARLKIEKSPLRYHCIDCGHEFVLDIQHCAGLDEIVCSSCESANITCVSSNGYSIGNMEIV